MGRKKIIIDKIVLEKLYAKNNLSPQKISLLFDCNWATVINRLKEHNIPLKTPAKARMKYLKQDFKGQIQEKAYMIGFRIGDLNVYRPGPTSETIVVRCHSTQTEQVDVFNSLFKKYGHIRLSKGSYGVHMATYLNNSFVFLLPKGDDAWDWLIKNEDAYSAFIAGYTDAEGNFILNQGRARFKIDSYDYSILANISKWLMSQGINNKFRQINKIGDPQGVNGQYHGDLWRLNVNDASSVENFIKCILPYLRHKIRIKDAKTCLKNITNRRNNGTVR